MIYKFTKLPQIGVIAIFLIMLGAFITGCHSRVAKGKDNIEAESSEPKRIIDIRSEAAADSADVYIQGNRVLSYSTVKQASPFGIIIYFADTSLDTPKTSLTEESNIISSISASESTENGHTSKIEILLKEDIPYDVSREDTGLKISFRKKEDEKLTAESSAVEPSSATRAPASTATRLQTVYATPVEDGLKVFVEADGTIANYKSFTIGSPARIVFDIFNVASPYKTEKKVVVDSKWVKQVRYQGYADRLRVVLDTDKPYLSEFSAYPVDNGLVIYMGKNAKLMDSSRQMISPGEIIGKTMPSATRLQSVYATQIENGIMVTVRANGAISDYKSSTMENPATIVFDIPNLMNPTEKEESFPVDSQWVKRIRHINYPDKLRLFIETQPSYLSNFSAYPYKNGFIIRVGGIGSGGTVKEQQVVKAEQYIPRDVIPKKGRQEKKQTGSSYKGTAFINRIDFQDKSAGKTALVIGTTRPISYDITESSDKRLQLKLFNTRIPPHQQRPLITTRFESAVDRITPLYKRSKGDASIFEIEMREKVPYFVEQTGDLLTVNFEASSIPPKRMVEEPVVSLHPQPEKPADTIAKKEPEVKTEPKAEQLPVSPPAAMAIDTPAAGQPSAVSPAAPVASPPMAVKIPVPVSQPSTPAVVPTLHEPIGIGTSPRIEDASDKYTGEKIALDFFETDVKNVFRILREVSGKNFAIDNDVSGKVTLTLEHPVPWDQVLDLILKMNRLGKTFEGNIIRIASVKTLEDEQKDRENKLKAQASIKEQQKALEPVDTEYIPVNYSKADKEILPHIEKIITKEPKDRASVTVDIRTNMIIITDTAEKRKQARQVVEKLDRVTPQVIIEAKVVEASTSFSREIGTQWGAGGGVQPTSLISSALGTGTTGSTGTSSAATTNIDNRVGVGPERGYDALGGTYGYNMAVNLPSNSVGALGFNFMRIAGTPLLLNAKLMAMESQGQGRIVSSPKIVTLDNKQASIKQGLRYPYNKLDDKGNTTTTFEEIDLLLDVVPHVTPDNRISMLINIAKKDLGDVINNQQSFTTKEAKTELLVNDGDTVVIAGIIKSTENAGETGIPGLAKIPILGWLFKSKTGSDRKEELLIFITPRIVQLEQRVAQF